MRPRTSQSVAGRARRRTFVRSLPTLVALAALAAAAAPAPGQVAPDAFAAVEARNIGPAGMSGRVAAVDVVLSDPTVIYVGSATGGLFRSDDGGLTWDPVFDDQRVLGIGAVSVFQANPDIVWVGTGEANPRNSAGVGWGVWKSVDGGRTWTHLGLEDSERISRVVTHPTDPDVAWVAALGPAWSDSEERGVFRTTDGGETWERVLGADARTGAADLVMDPGNPDKLIAALWEYRREPWFFTSGGPGSGMFITHDGGDSWTEITAEDGLPPGPLGRIGLGIAASDPDVVYALVEAERSELVRSDDGGHTWRTVSDEPGIVPRPFYYADLRVDPANENRIYSLHSRVEVSEDGGRTFRTVVPSQIIHGDVHELWIDPSDSRHMIMGNDGGIGITRDRGENWRFVENLALAQFYRIAVDDAVPFNVYGGLQDNGSWYGPSDVWESRGILNAHWRRVGGGDGFSVMPDWSDPRYGYSMSQQGNLMRFDRVTGARHAIQPLPPGDGEPAEALRFNWNAGFAQDPHDSLTIYLGSQFLHRSRDHGASWEIMSPDLTTDDPAKQRQDVSGGLTLDATGAENHTTIIDVSPSPVRRGTLWVATDDGNVQVTTDDGATWTNVGRNIDGAPATGWAADVEPSRHDPATAYVVFDEHRRGDWGTYVFRTTDLGASWERLPTEEVFGFAHDLAEDPEEPNLLFLGTEFGLWYSLDGGSAWRKWTSNGLPPVPVREAVVHPRDGDLVVGTHGRGAWVVDDIRPLRALAADPAVAERAVHLFTPPPAYLHEVAEAIGYRSTGHAMFQAETRPYGALLSYWVGRDDVGDRAEISIRDADGTVVRTLSGPASPGVNRVVWNLRAEDGVAPPHAPGSEVLPGPYDVTVTVGGSRTSGTLDVRPDPRIDVRVADLRAKLALQRELDAYGELLDDARERVRAALDGLEAARRALPDDAQALGADIREATDTLEALRERFFTGPECQGICGGDPLAGTVGAPRWRLRSSSGAPTPTEREAVARARAALTTIVEGVNRVLSMQIAPLRAALVEAGVTPLPELGPLALPGDGAAGGG